jgi:hypothetical protein
MPDFLGIAVFALIIPSIMLAIMCWGMVEVMVELFKRRPGHGITYGPDRLAQVLEASMKDKKPRIRPVTTGSSPAADAYDSLIRL